MDQAGLVLRRSKNQLSINLWLSLQAEIYKSIACTGSAVHRATCIYFWRHNGNCAGISDISYSFMHMGREMLKRNVKLIDSVARVVPIYGVNLLHWTFFYRSHAYYTTFKHG